MLDMTASTRTYKQGFAQPEAGIPVGQPLPWPVRVASIKPQAVCASVVESLVAQPNSRCRIFCVSLVQTKVVVVGRIAVMLSTPRLWAPMGVLILGVKEAYGSAIHYNAPYCNTSSTITTVASIPPSYVPSPATSVKQHNSSSISVVTTTVPTTIVSYTASAPHYSNATISTTTTRVISYTTTAVTTDSVTTSVTVPTTTTNVISYTTTAVTTDSVTTSVTVPTTTTVPTTITSFATFTITPTPTSSVYVECPTTCSISAGTVNLFFWPTNNDYSYPSTYVDTALDYTFTSPSVYMVINSIFGYNSLGLAGPSATNAIFALDLDEVSTIVPGVSATRQLTLNDLGTDCPQSAEPSAILTMTDAHCDPTLVAPDVVKSWASPCNACGKFGLFDPPYAIPTIPGGLLGTTATAVESTTTEATTAATSAATGATATATATATTTPTTTATTTTPVVASTPTTAAESTAAGTTGVMSLGPSGIVVVYYYSGTAVTTTVPATGSTAVVDGQTITSGGAAVTLTSVVIDVSSVVATASNSDASSSDVSSSDASATTSALSSPTPTASSSDSSANTSATSSSTPTASSSDSSATTSATSSSTPTASAVVTAAAQRATVEIAALALSFLATTFLLY
ncbi:hypothetical protein SCAR479_11615 [Seiridium cardinale]|uniref:Uncharacterized protein n=1 Tax=Seiridium cardinale TaxID=138064 RepID=A0ABR2XDM9_9PEZI